MDVFNILSVAGVSTIKIIPAFIMAAGMGMQPLETFISISVGGISGVIFFSFWGTRIKAWLRDRRLKKGKPPKPINFKKARKILRIWRRFGLYGIAALTPPLLSPPVGAIIAVTFGEKHRRILIYMSISTFAWAGIFALFGNTIQGWLG